MSTQDVEGSREPIMHAPKNEKQSWSWFAIGGFFLAVCGVLTPLASMLAMFLSLMGVQHAKKNGKRGRVLAWWGFVLGLLNILIGIFGGDINLYQLWG